MSIRRGPVVLVVLVAPFLVSALVIALLPNLYSLATERCFYVPTESSVRAFEVTVRNPGSGDWWLYGQDAEHYYAQSDDAHYEYLVLDRAALPPGASPTDKAGWGAAARRSRAPARRGCPG